ncbi:HaeIII family restriction endonuclease [Pantanalinema sp. GBBB05]|uniref:HaeIII family restriction endonuclease n=1 Tax=Pantanalinema sp. GBBB05 TaxID=2604139 RepID=UPI001DFA0B53|nr:HaeIII family restriction endonuclease [Pantanalinema sp. GBBB05]
MQSNLVNISNQYGRALEYAIVAELLQQLPNQVQLTSRAIKDQQRDALHYISLPIITQQNYKKCAVQALNWLKQNFSIANHVIMVDRLPDHASKQGDVTDIRISFAASTINLSIKHNHRALKHQRPGSTAQHCGFARKSQEDIEFRTTYKNITQAFLLVAQGTLKFCDLGQRIVFDNLYSPICYLVATFINQNCSQQLHASHLFSFLVGKIDFHKLIFQEKEQLLVVEEFSRLTSPESVVAQANQNYVYLNFSNGWELAMRLHTASSRIGNNPSLKFDTQPKQIIVPKQIFNV